MAMKKNFEFIRGETVTFSLEVEPEKMTGEEILRLTAKPAYDNDLTDNAAVIQKQIMGSEEVVENTWTMWIYPQDTIEIPPGKYVYDLVLTSGSNRVTLLEGTIKIKAAATLRGVK